MNALLAFSLDFTKLIDLRPFGVNWPHFIAQLINFAIVAWVLKKFAFDKVTNMLEERRMRIAEGEEKIKIIEEKLAASERSTAEALAKANADAQRLIDEAKTSAERIGEQKAQEAIDKARQIMQNAQAAAKTEQDQMRIELKQEIGRLVALTAGKVSGKILTADDHRRINEETIAGIRG